MTRTVPTYGDSFGGSWPCGGITAARSKEELVPNRLPWWRKLRGFESRQG